MEFAGTSFPLNSVSLRPNLLNDRVTDLLRDAIVTGRVRPGSRLVEREVSERMGVSRAPVRDALLRLETEGLIENRRDGRYVATLDDEQIGSLYDVRRNLEGFALRLAVENITDADIAELGDLVTGLRSACTVKETESFARWDVELHTRLWDVAGNAYLTRLLSSVYGPIAMVVHACSAEHAHRRDIVSEHEALFAAVAARDADRAVAAIDTHLRNACARLLGPIAAT